MKLNRFALTLYLTFPTIGSLASIFMIAHFVVWVEGITAAHPYSDALIYVAMATNEMALFGDTHITWRFLIPWISGVITGWFGGAEAEGMGIFMGSLNFVILILALGLLIRFSFHNEKINAVMISTPAWCIVLLPAFWRGAYLPMLEPAAMLVYALVLLALWYRRIWALYIILCTGIWVKEMVLLSVLLVPAFHYARQNYEWKDYLPFVMAAIVYFGSVSLFGSSSGNYVMQPIAWVRDWMGNLSSFQITGIRYIFSGFGLGLFYLIWRMYSVPGQRIHRAALAVMLATFMIFLLYTPSNTPRLMFMVMPVLFLFNQSDYSLGKSHEKLVFQENDDDTQNR